MEEINEINNQNIINFEENNDPKTILSALFSDY